MKKFLRFAGYLLLAIIIVVGAGLSYIKFKLPDVGKAPDIKVAMTPEHIAHGAYLANHVTVCMDCHSTRDWTKFSGPLTPGTLGRGGEIFDQQFGFPGKFISRNITPYRLKNWTDGEIFRAVTTGVDRNGEPLFPVMPYHYYGQMDKEDIYDIIAYVRSLPEIKYDVPPSVPDFPMNFIERTIPATANPVTRPIESNVHAYGEYMVMSCGCVECHTEVDKGQIIKGKEFQGGREFSLPWGIVRSANITPDETGIGNWTKEQFIQRFRSYTDSSYVSPVMDGKSFNSIMPWTMYGGMKETDLAAIYDYLRTLKPTKHMVEKFTPKS